MRIVPDIFRFSGGEFQVSLKNHKLNLVDNAWLDSRDFNKGKAFDVVALGQAVDILRHKGFKDISLKMLYMPYSRQDRRMVDGESHSLKVFANIINSFGFKQVVTLDPHSDVCEALFNNLNIIDNTELLDRTISYVYNRNHKEIIVIAPDAGAFKKIFKAVSSVLEKNSTSKLGQYYENLHIEVIIANKVRDVKTGEIVKTEVPRKYINSQALNVPIIVLDDICDGGRTFIELAKAIPHYKNKHLIVSHGIFSKGLDDLRSHYSTITTSDSIIRTKTFDLFLNVIRY